MLLVGLTGGIASGKSLVARAFKELGAHIIDADRIVHELLEPDQEAWREIVDHFGRGILFPDNVIDRRTLGELVFNDAEKREWLNKCLHPRVFAAYTCRVNHLRDREPDAVIVLDAAMLIETGYHRNMDKIVVVYAEREQQIERLAARDALTRSQALARIASQMPLAEKRGHADYVIDNTRKPEDARRLAGEVFKKLRQEAERA
jgi:dephospho-CoA kinase